MSDKTHLACGRHVLVDISDAEPAILNDAERLEQALTSAAVTEGVTVLGTLRKTFDPSGVTILLLLAESHISLHTYPDLGKAFFDAFTCGTDYDPARIFQSVSDVMGRGTCRMINVQRGYRPLVLRSDARWGFSVSDGAEKHELSLGSRVAR